MHLTVFSFIDRATLHITKFATNFKNLNVIEKGHPLSELNLEHLQKAVEITKNLEDYFRRNIMCGQKDDTLATISQRPNVPSVVSTQATKPPSNAPSQRPVFSQAPISATCER